MTAQGAIRLHEAFSIVNSVSTAHADARHKATFLHNFA